MLGLSRYAPVVLRFGLVAVFLWFSSAQLLEPVAWVGMIPAWATGFMGIPVEIFVILNGLAELLLALMLAFGVYARVVAALLALHLLTIVLAVGWNDVGARDFGLMLAALSVALHGPDKWTWDFVRVRPASL